MRLEPGFAALRGALTTEGPAVSQASGAPCMGKEWSCQKQTPGIFVNITRPSNPRPGCLKRKSITLNWVVEDFTSEVVRDGPAEAVAVWMLLAVVSLGGAYCLVQLMGMFMFWVLFGDGVLCDHQNSLQAGTCPVVLWLRPCFLSRGHGFNS